MENKWLLIQERDGGFLITFPPEENQESESVTRPTLVAVSLILKDYFDTQKGGK